MPFESGNTKGAGTQLQAGHTKSIGKGRPKGIFNANDADKIKQRLFKILKRRMAKPEEVEKVSTETLIKFLSQCINTSGAKEVITSNITYISNIDRDKIQGQTIAAIYKQDTSIDTVTDNPALGIDNGNVCDDNCQGKDKALVSKDLNNDIGILSKGNAISIDNTKSVPDVVSTHTQPAPTQAPIQSNQDIYTIQQNDRDRDKHRQDKGNAHDNALPCNDQGLCLARNGGTVGEVRQKDACPGSGTGSVEGGMVAGEKVVVPVSTSSINPIVHTLTISSGLSKDTDLNSDNAIGIPPSFLKTSENINTVLPIYPHQESIITNNVRNGLIVGKNTLDREL